jgi:hypothetical protein
MKSLFLAAAIAVTTLASPGWASSAIASKPVQFQKGESSASIKGTLKGDQIVDYKLRARAGQTMNVHLQTSNRSAYFNVLPPGSDEQALFVGSISGNEWNGVLPADGEYRLRTYLMRNAARRNESATYTLSVGITGSSSAAGAMGTAAASDAKVKGTPYHATGQLPCAMGEVAKASVQCEFGVIRGQPGHAEVHLTPPGGLERVLIFAGTQVSSDGDAQVKVSKQGDVWSVEVNDFEHYQIPEAVISGG